MSASSAPPPAPPPRETSEWVLLSELLAAVATARTVPHVAEVLARQAKWLLPCDRCALLEVRDDGARWCALPADATLAADERGPIARVLRARSPLRYVRPSRDGEDRGDDAREPLGAATAAVLGGAGCALLVPLLDGERAVGALVFTAATRDAFPRGAVGVPATLALATAAAVRALRALEREQQARRAVEHALRARDALLACVAHDLTTPLNVIHLNAQLVARRLEGLAPPADETTRGDLATIRSNVRRMQNMISDLVDGARIEAEHGLHLCRTWCDAREVVQHSISDLRPVVAQRVDLALPPHPLLGFWDAERLARVLSNLLSNAAKYSPAGGAISVRAEDWRDAARSWTTISVQDQGVGIPEDELPRLFQRFYRARNVAKRFPGTGIGLANAREIVAAHGGRLEVSSVEGAGSTFQMILPLGS